MGGDYTAIWWVLALPLVGFLIQALLGQSAVKFLGIGIGRAVMGFLAVSFVAAPFFMSLAITWDLIQKAPGARLGIETLFYWIDLQSISIPFEVRVDPLSMTMTLIITGVGMLIHLYATAYMAHDRDFTKFFAYLNLFVFFMLILVLGNNLGLLFIGWEGVGLCSYLLIGFWYQDLGNSRAANKAFIVNRIGDYGLALGVFSLVVLLAGNQERLGITDSRWLSYDVILPAVDQIIAQYPVMATMIALFLFIGAMGKSAQFPLYLWLPDAMAGPTPVSALIHAATMVTAGVFLLNRLSELFLASPVAMAIIAIIGAFTALFAALIAFGQTDIKKVLAYSTVSQLGFMFLACGMGVFWAGLFHVTTHAFFKALLFLGAGAVIHAMSHDQDLRNYGQLRKYLPITFGTMAIGWAAIAGFPFLFAGFWSKEAILAGAIDSGTTLGMVLGLVGFAVAALTAAYMTRLMLLTFGSGAERWRELAPSHPHHEESHDDPYGEPLEEPVVPSHTTLPGEDPDDYFMSEEEYQMVRAAEISADHHALEASHEPREVPWMMWVPLAVLAVLSTFTGYLLYSVDSFSLKYWLEPGLRGQETVHVWPTALLYGLSFLAFAGGTVWAWMTYGKQLPKREGHDESVWSPLRRAAANQFGYDKAMSDHVAMGAGGTAARFSAAFDRLVIDGIVRMISYLVALLGHFVTLFQRGFVRGYAVYIMIGAVAFAIYLIVTMQGGQS